MSDKALEEVETEEGAAARPWPRVVATDRWEDVEPALRLVYREFLAQGYAEPNPWELRVLDEYLNPGLRCVVCEIDGEIAGVQITIPDGPHGLPVERTFRSDVDEMRRDGPLVEAGSLVVARRFRRRSRLVVPALFVGTYLSMREDETLLACSSAPLVAYCVATFGFRIVAESGDHFGAPGVLAAAHWADVRRVVAMPRRTIQRDLVAMFEQSSDWFQNQLGQSEWPPERLVRIMEERAVER